MENTRAREKQGGMHPFLRLLAVAFSCRYLTGKLRRMLLCTVGLSIAIYFISLYKLGFHHHKSPNLRVISIPTPEGNSTYLEDVISNADTVHGFRLASYYGDHMVLEQAPARAIIWGYAAEKDLGHVVMLHLTIPLTPVTMTYNATVVKGRRGDVEWGLELDPLTNPGPYSITVQLNSYSSLHLIDIMAGDVWVCSGQSNMRFPVPKMFNASAELEAAHLFPHIRVFTVAVMNSSTPLNDFPAIAQPWSPASKVSLADPNGAYFSAVCWLFGKRIHEALGGRPIGLVASHVGGTNIEAWSSPDAIRQCNFGRQLPTALIFPTAVPPRGRITPASSLWNAMVHPLLPMTIHGVIWYQGEGNVYYNRDAYKCTFPAMITDWRVKWRTATGGQTSDSFPFGFVQIGPSYYKNGDQLDTGFAAIRWHQTDDTGTVPNYNMRNTFMASAVDLTDLDSPYGPVHPRDKETVGDRLALSGLAVAYGLHSGRYQGPTETAYFVDIGYYTLRIEFDNATMPLTVRSKDGFEVCCSHDNTTQCSLATPMSAWTPVEIIGVTNTSVVLDWRQCSGMWLMGYRYLWRDTPCPYKRCAVYSTQNELPLTPRIIPGIFGYERDFHHRMVNNIPVRTYYAGKSL